MFQDNTQGAFCTFRFWEGIGLLFGYASGSFMCIDHKLYMLLGLLVLSAATYYVTEYVQRRLEAEERLNNSALPGVNAPNQEEARKGDNLAGPGWIIGQSIAAAALRSRPSIISISSLDLPYNGALLSRAWPAAQTSVLYESAI